MKTTKDYVLAELFELSKVGLNETDKYVFKKNDNIGRMAISPNKLMEQAPTLFGQISDKGLVSIGESYYTITGIKLKGSRS